MNSPASIKKYSVVHIIDRLYTGGAERVLLTLANIFCQRGHAVKVVTIVEPGPLAAQLLPGITTVNLGRTFKLSLATMRKLVQQIKHVDVVHVHSSFNMRYVFLATRLFLLRKPIFFHEHFGDIDINTSVSWHQKFIYPKTVMICVSRRIAEWALHNLPVDKNKVFVLHNIVTQKQGLPQRISDGGELKLVMVANIRRTKNLQFAIELLNRLKATRTCSLTIIGKRVEADYYGELMALVEKYQLEDDIKMIHDADEVQPLLHKFDMAIHTAKSESGPLVLIEYLAQTLPFVTYNTGETVLQVKDDLPGFIANSFEFDEWIDRVETILLQDKATLQKKLADIFDKYFSEEAHYNNCIAIYNSALAGR